MQIVKLVYKGGSMSALLKHLQMIHPEDWKPNSESGKEKSQSQSSLFIYGVTSVRPCSNNRSLMITRHLSEWITSDLHSFNVVDGKGFRSFDAEVEPNYKISSHQTLLRCTESRYKELLCKVVLWMWYLMWEWYFIFLPKPRQHPNLFPVLFFGFDIYPYIPFHF